MPTLKYGSQNDIMFLLTSNNIKELVQEFLAVLSSAGEPYQKGDYEKVFDVLEELKLRANEFPERIAQLKKIVEEEKTKEESNYIHTYTDKDGLEDGILIDISNLKLTFQGKRLNRITSNLYGQLEEHFASTESGKQREELKSTLKTKLSMAYYKGDIWQVPPGLWLMENDVDGWTLMFPEDY